MMWDSRANEAVEAGCGEQYAREGACLTEQCVTRCHEAKVELTDKEWVLTVTGLRPTDYVPACTPTIITPLRVGHR